MPLEPPGPEDVARLTRRVVRRLSKISSRYLADRQDDCVHLDPDDERATLDHALSVVQRPPVRPQGVLGLSGLAPAVPPQPELCTALGGFSLHAARVVESRDRQGLERLCRYGLRAPFSQKRLSVLPDGQVRYELPRPWPNPSGVTELIMEPVQFLKRLAALLPAPYQNSVRYHGVFANRSRHRPQLPLPPEATAPNASDHADEHPCIVEPHFADTSSGQQTVLPLETHDDPDDPDDPDDLDDFDDFQQDLPAVRPRKLPWASLLKRSLGIDGLACPRCGAQMALLALITAPTVVTYYSSVDLPLLIWSISLV